MVIRPYRVRCLNDPVWDTDLEVLAKQIMNANNPP